ncbi:DASH family cryptochrome [Lacimicrobium alkaliphilum]|uniref:Cryptochrome DASH n=1 Tax=Lacimicrobium alkaliphilum TaxID=1526571 RepID=A0ABQ1RIL1_9ALTE|nr:DASH family cryptochrome [Lacimicrobium alkaliphilum]GGD69173.1 deoxyribodipyrimidine photo-lyase [Lacimicrobium alkaliphilum]
MHSDIGVMLFSEDLRVDDNAALQAASRHDQLLCIYVFDELKTRKASEWSAIGPFRARFIWESLIQLKQALNSLGQELLILKGDLLEILHQLHSQTGSICIYRQSPSAWYEMQQTRRIAEHFPLRLIGSPTLLEPESLPFNLADMPESFTPFRKKAEAKWPDIIPLHKPTSLPPVAENTIQSLTSCPLPCRVKDEPGAVLHFSGGEVSGWQRLTEYIWQQRALRHYKDTRNGMLGANYSSKFSPWLAQGCISPKRVYQQVKAYEASFGANESTYWLIFELLWRDFFHFRAKNSGKDFFQPSHAKPGQKTAEPSPPVLRKWCQGTTGNDFVDANMRELLCSGFISNRGRQNVASYLIYELQLDWRLGAAWFEHQLIDYDAASNYGNWCYIAGIAHDPRQGRHFNIDAQARRYDPERQYRDYWLNQG